MNADKKKFGLSFLQGIGIGILYSLVWSIFPGKDAMIAGAFTASMIIFFVILPILGKIAWFGMAAGFYASYFVSYGLFLRLASVEFGTRLLIGIATALVISLLVPLLYLYKHKQKAAPDDI